MVLIKQRFAKFISILLCVSFMFAALMSGTCVFADENDQTQDGSGSVLTEGHIGASSPTLMPDKNVTFTVYLDGRSALAISATFEYPSAVMEYKGFESKVNGFTMSVTQRDGENGVKYLDVFGISTDLTASLEGVASVISFDFHINKDAKDGDSVYLNMISADASDGERDYALSDLLFQGKVSLTDTTGPAVESIKINGKMFDGFSVDVLQYSIKVEYSVSALAFDIVCREGTSAAIRGNENLQVGENTVFIDVVTEGAGTITYSIKVERLADPNHVISTDASLADVKLSAGFVSPKIEKDVFDYIIYLPADAVELTLEPIAANKLATTESKTVAVGNGESNTVELSVTAEDGRVCVYTFTLLVTPNYDGKVPIIGGENADISKIDFGGKDGLYLPLPKPIEEFLTAHGIGAAHLLIICVCIAALLVIALAVILFVLLKKKKKKTIAYVEDTLEGEGVISKNGAGASSDDDIEANVF